MARFIPLSSQLLYPLQQVANHDPLQWNNKCKEVFQEVKDVLARSVLDSRKPQSQSFDRIHFQVVIGGFFGWFEEAYEYAQVLYWLQREKEFRDFGVAPGVYEMIASDIDGASVDIRQYIGRQLRQKINDHKFREGRHVPVAADPLAMARKIIVTVEMKIWEGRERVVWTDSVDLLKMR